MYIVFFQSNQYLFRNVAVEGWSAEATATFEELAQGQILQALLVEYASDGIPCVHLYRVQGISVSGWGCCLCFLFIVYVLFPYKIGILTA